MINKSKFLVTVKMLGRENFIYKVIPLLKVLNFMISRTILTDNEENCINIFLLMIVVFTFFQLIMENVLYQIKLIISP